MSTPVTTLILLKAHEPSDPPSITDAASQAGQAFNQVLRCIAGCTGFQSQLFGWPPQPDAEEVNMNDYVASIMPGTLAVFVNWRDRRSADIFITPSSLKQAFQGLTTFFAVPEMASNISPTLNFSEAPLAFNIAWAEPNAIRILDRTRDPMKISIQQTETQSRQEGSEPSDSANTTEGDARGTILGQEAGQSLSVSVRSMVHLNPSSILSSYSEDELLLSLMRTRHCTRIKQDLNDMIHSRRVD